MPRRLIVSVEWDLTRPNGTAEVPFPPYEEETPARGACVSRVIIGRMNKLGHGANLLNASHNAGYESVMEEDSR